MIGKRGGTLHLHFAAFWVKVRWSSTLPWEGVHCLVLTPFMSVLDNFSMLGLCPGTQ